MDAEGQAPPSCHDASLQEDEEDGSGTRKDMEEKDKGYEENRRQIMMGVVCRHSNYKIG